MNNKSIIQELDHTPIPSYIKEAANDIWMVQGKKTHRNKPRKEMLFFCLMEAYKKHDMLVEPRQIAEYVNLTANEIKGIDVKFAHSNNYTKEIVIATPENFLKIFCDDLNLNNEVYEEIFNTYHRIIKKKNWILIHSYPQNVALAVIYYYLTTHGIQIIAAKFEQLGHIKIGTIKNIGKQVALIDNS